MFSMQLVFYKISLGHFQTRSKSLSRALLQFEHTNAQHTGIWWLPRPTFCQAAPFVIIPHWRCYCSHSLEWSCDRLEISVHTNCQSSHLYFSHFLSHSLEHWQNTVYFLTSQEDLKLQFEIILVFLTQCFTLVGVIIWESQRIQTPKTRTLLFLTLFVEWSFGNLKAYKLLKLALLYTIQVYFP